MSNLPPENSDNEVQDEPTDDPLWLDLKAYDNPEVFRDATLPQVYKLRICSLHAPDISHILKIEVEGDSLSEVIQKTLIWVIKQDPSFDGDPETLQAELTSEADYWESELSIRRFFLRHLPKLLLHAYDIAITTAVLYEIGNLMDRRAEREKLIKQTLVNLLRGLERDVKKMLATRSSGRPSTAEDRMPDIVHNVLNIVQEIMGNRRGKDAVPVLKTVAHRLNLTETALRKKLVRAGHPWAGIKSYFENRP
ncbi:MAG TPA: hypothetical protein VKB05_03855 [Pyrinomonadaceae bacterium]|nr:hypothetical protein [Pyrinomonadaceae bacterium]